MPVDFHYTFLKRNKWQVSAYAGILFNKTVYEEEDKKFSDDFERSFSYGGFKGGFLTRKIYAEKEIGIEFAHLFLKKYEVTASIEKEFEQGLNFGFYDKLFFHLKVGRNFEFNPAKYLPDALPQKGDFTYGVIYQRVNILHSNWSRNENGIGAYAEKNLSNRFSLYAGIIYGSEITTDEMNDFSLLTNPNWTHGYAYSTKYGDRFFYVPVHVGFNINPKADYRVKIFAGINPGVDLGLVKHVAYTDGTRSFEGGLTPSFIGFDEFGFEVCHSVMTHYVVSFGLSESILLFVNNTSLSESGFAIHNLPMLIHFKLGRVKEKKRKPIMGVRY